MLLVDFSAAWQRHRHWMSIAAAGICRLKCFWRCFCCTFSAKPEPKIPCRPTKHPSDWNTLSGTKWFSVSIRLTYGWKCEKRYGEDTEARGNDFSQPRLGHRVAVAYGRDGYLQKRKEGSGGKMLNTQLIPYQGDRDKGSARMYKEKTHSGWQGGI